MLYSTNLTRKVLFLSFCYLPFFFTTEAQTVTEGGADRCGTMSHHNYMMQTSPEYRATRKQIDKQARHFVQRAKTEGAGGGVIIIPVAFHVVYNASAPAQNISDDKIQAQIQQLNVDYRRMNSDRGSTPSAFQGFAADLEIQFCLATRDPNGNATTGITRTTTSSTSFTETTFDAEKPSTVWDRDKYLNLWSANLSGGLLGYAQFPGDVAETDGVVLLYSTVGSLTNQGTKTNYPSGRTASHEVGHWLNLYHIWGDDNGACTGNDYVDDTPNQANSTSGCATFPKLDACTPATPGVMFMNYMDYSYDNCLNMFTLGQKARMVACLNGIRSSILTSNGCTPLTAHYCINANIGTQATCAGANINYTILTTAQNGYTNAINLSATDLPTGCTASLSSPSVAPGGSATVNLSVASNVAPGFYSFWIKTTSTANSDSIALTFWVQQASLSATPTLLAPTNNALGQSTTPVFTWTRVVDASLYDFQLSTTSNFSNVILSENNLSTNSIFVPTASPLSNLTTYYWRVLAKNTCTSTAYATGIFTTGDISCADFTNNTPKTISATGTPQITSAITFPNTGTVTDINVTNIDITHNYISDLTLSLRAPNNTVDILVDQPCSSETSINMGFDDQSSNGIGSYPCPPSNGQLYQPDNPLSVFNGIAAMGLWTLVVKDNYTGDGGTLNAWSIRVCTNTSTVPVELVDFSAKPLTKTIQLLWQTATEVNNAGFDIQRSMGPLSSFTSIGYVKGQGNASKLVDYQYVDAAIHSGITYYYRLRQLDFDGKEVFSKVESANLEKNAVWDISVQPNPAESVLNIEILGTLKEDTSLDLFSIDGKLLMSKKVSAESTHASLDLAPLSSGIYMLKCQTGLNYLVKKIVKR